MRAEVWLPPCERVGGERHPNPHRRSSRRTVRGEVRWCGEDGFLMRASAVPTAGLILTMDRRPSAVLTRVLAARLAP
jgi:hypothetical protein